MRWDLDLQTTESIGHLVAIKFCIKRSFDRVSPALISDPILFSLVTPPPSIHRTVFLSYINPCFSWSKYPITG
jgi:hypothetical protein